MIVTAVAPSNIAFIKYWGKSEPTLQWPANSSLSMTLKNCRTITSIQLSKADRHEVTFKGRSEKPEKVLRFVERFTQYIGLTEKLSISTENTFPSSCGIASSASGYACLTVALAAFASKARTWRDLENKGMPRAELAKWARLGSGSACRSLFGDFVLWERGKSPDEQSVNKISSSLRLADAIVIVSDQEKKVSSSEGHQTAWTSPLFAERLSSVSKKIERAQEFLGAADFAGLGAILEEDSDSMHAIMETSKPGLVYRTAETFAVLEWVKVKRREGLQIYATVDAGPNVHILSMNSHQKILKKELEKDFSHLRFIFDEQGNDADVSFSWKDSL